MKSPFLRDKTQPMFPVLQRTVQNQIEGFCQGSMQTLGKVCSPHRKLFTDAVIHLQVATTVARVALRVKHSVVVLPHIVSEMKQLLDQLRGPQINWGSQPSETKWCCCWKRCQCLERRPSSRSPWAPIIFCDSTTAAQKSVGWREQKLPRAMETVGSRMEPGNAERKLMISGKVAGCGEPTTKHKGQSDGASIWGRQRDPCIEPHEDGLQL